MIRKMFTSVICLCALFVQTSCFAGLKDYPNIAVVNFSKKAAVSQDLTFDDASMVTDYVIDALLDTEMFNVIEREQLRAITDEHSFNASGLIDLSTATQIGKLHGVRYLVYGSVVGLSLKDKVVGYTNAKVGGIDNTQHTVVANITARFIDVETGRIVLTARGEGASSSTMTEFKFGKKIRESVENVEETEELDSEIEENEEIDDSATGEEVISNEHKITIGVVKVSQVQVHNALHKAADDIVFGKFGFLNKLERRGKRRK